MDNYRIYIFRKAKPAAEPKEELLEAEYHVMDEPVGKVYPGHGWPSLSTIYKIDYWLTRGVRVYTSRYNDAEKELLIEKYRLRWDERKRRYTNDPEIIWGIAKLCHKDRLIEWAITSYGELEYRATHR